jgi:hypothetical protein
MNLQELLLAMDGLIAEGGKPRPVFIKGLGAVHVREITVGEIDAQIEDTSNKANKWKVARGTTRLLCDEHGNRLLDPSNEEHVEKMAKMPLRVLNAINATAEEATKGN